MTEIRVTMVDVEGQLLAEIADKRMTRNDVALTMAFGLWEPQTKVDWAKVNHAILERWSMAGLKYIKERAWEIAQAAREAAQ